MNEHLVAGYRLQTAAEMDALPVGTVICETDDSSCSWTKDGNGQWADTDGGASPSSSFSTGGYNMIVSLGSDEPESLTRWQWRFRDNAYAAAERAGIAHDVVHRAVDQTLGLSQDKFPLGPGVSVSSSEDRERLPVGAVIYAGSPDTQHFGVFRRERTGWQQVLGNQGFDRHQYHTVHSAGDAETPGWWITPPAEGDADKVAEFKAKAWRIGWKVKTDQRWCASYEGYMARIGLTDEVLSKVRHNGLRAGDRVGLHESRNLPVGSVVEWFRRTDPDVWTWWVRDDGASHGLRFVCGSDNAPERRTGRTFTVLHLNVDEDDPGFVPDWSKVMSRLPAGTRLSASGTLYMVSRDHRIGGRPSDGSVVDHGSWDWHQFDPGTLRIELLVSAPTVHEILARYNLDDQIRAPLADALLDREEAIAGLLRLAGMQFGLFPQIVTEVLAEAGLGRPMPEAERAMVRQQFIDLMNQIEAAQNGEGPMPQP